MSTADGGSSTRFDELKPGDRIEVEHTVTAGAQSRREKTVGTVVRTERRCGCFCRGTDDKVSSNVILLELPDGELTTVTVDGSTVLRRA